MSVLQEQSLLLYAVVGLLGLLAVIAWGVYRRLGDILVELRPPALLPTPQPGPQPQMPMPQTLDSRLRREDGKVIAARGSSTASQPQQRNVPPSPERTPDR
jgi:hypothetical protein